MQHLLFIAATLITMTSCAVNTNISAKNSGTTFVYKPSAPVAEGPKFPVKIAVLPFKDGTDDFTRLGSIFDAESLTFNLAKSGIAGIISPVTPDVWAKAFADDMAASGSFQKVRFVYSQMELSDEKFFIEGTLEKAYAAGGWTRPSEYVLWLRAVRRSDNRSAWEKKVTRAIMAKQSDYDVCGTNIQCMADRSQKSMNLVMQDMFAEARADFLLMQDFASEIRTGRDSLSEGTSSPPRATESVDDTIEMILKGK